jgi:hypothetical protein
MTGADALHFPVESGNDDVASEPWFSNNSSDFKSIHIFVALPRQMDSVAGCSRFESPGQMIMLEH